MEQGAEYYANAHEKGVWAIGYIARAYGAFKVPPHDTFIYYFIIETWLNRKCFHFCILNTTKGLERWTAKQLI